MSAWVQEISDNLGSFFRYLFPGAFVLGAIKLAFPTKVNFNPACNWEHLVFAGVASLIVGNALFVVNRYGLHQLIDFIAYCLNYPGPVPSPGMSFLKRPFHYNSDLTTFIKKSLTACTAQKARQHISFRASTSLYAYTIALTLAFVAIQHEGESVVANYLLYCWIFCFVSFIVGIWQQLIARGVDYNFHK